MTPWRPQSVAHPAVGAVVLAVGAFLKNVAGLLQPGRWTESAVHGDLRSPDAVAALSASLDRLCAQARADGTPIVAVAHDLHPDFPSTEAALRVASALGVPAIGIGHHEAHLAAVQAEGSAEAAAAQGAVGLALDGFGLGPDGGAWGGEVLQQGADGHWQRRAHLQPLALPGGDRAALQPWRLAAAALHALGRGDEIARRFGPQVGADRAAQVAELLRRGLRCPPTSSAGRWFDAAAAALGLVLHQVDEAAAPRALQAAAERSLLRAAPADARLRPMAPNRGDDPHGRAAPAHALPQSVSMLEILEVLLDFVPQNDAAASGAECPAHAAAADDAALAFHRHLAEALARAAAPLARAAGATQVLAGGGCWMNRVLAQTTAAALEARGLTLRLPQRPCGDAGLALGQAWQLARVLSSQPSVSAAVEASSASLPPPVSLSRLECV